MPYIPDQQSNTGQFVPTTNVWEVSQIGSMDVNSEEFKLLLVRLYQNVNNISIALNAKDAGYYVEQEFNTGQQFFNPTSNNQLDLRGAFRKTVNTGALAAGVNTVAHGLTIGSTWSFTKILGAASNTTAGNYYPLPFASAGGAANIEVRLDNTNIIITNNSGVTFTTSVIILEYLKS